MADLVSHHLFGSGTRSVLPASAQRPVDKWPACYYWGCQGPDPLFYRKIYLGSPLHSLGNRMHSQHTGRLFAALARTVHLLSDEAGEMAAAYFYGFLCHYALDSTIHPYVYCREEEFCAENARLNPSAVHSSIESDIDCLVYERAYHRPVTEFEPERHYTLAPEEKAVLSVVLHAVLLDVYGEDIPVRELRRSFDEMLAWECFLYSDSRAVYRGARTLETLAGRGALLTGHMKVEPPAWDALNLSHRPWHNPWTPGEERRDSVPELFALARIRAASLAGQYAAQFDIGWLLHHPFTEPFDNGSPKNSESVVLRQGKRRFFALETANSVSFRYFFVSAGYFLPFCLSMRGRLC